MGGDGGDGGDGGIGGDSGGLGGDTGGDTGGEAAAAAAADAEDNAPSSNPSSEDTTGPSIGQSALATQADAQAAMSNLGYGQVGFGQVGQAVGQDTGNLGFGFGNIGGFGFGPSIGVNGFGIGTSVGNLSVGTPGLGFNEGFSIPGVNLGPQSDVGTLSQATISNQAEQEAQNAINVAMNPALSFNTPTAPPGVNIAALPGPTAPNSQTGITDATLGMIPSQISVDPNLGLFSITPTTPVPVATLGPQIATTATDLAEMAVPAPPQAEPTAEEDAAALAKANQEAVALGYMTSEGLTGKNAVTTTEPANPALSQIATTSLPAISIDAPTAHAPVGVVGQPGPANVSNPGISPGPSIGSSLSGYGGYGGVSGVPGEGTSSAVGSQGGGLGVGGFGGGTAAGQSAIGIQAPPSLAISPQVAMQFEAQQRGLTFAPPTVPGPQAPPQSQPNTGIAVPSVGIPTSPFSSVPGAALPAPKGDLAIPPQSIPPTVVQTVPITPTVPSPPLPVIPVTMDPNMVAPPSPPVAVPVPTQKEIDQAKADMAKALPHTMEDVPSALPGKGFQSSTPTMSPPSGVVGPNLPAFGPPTALPAPPPPPVVVEPQPPPIVNPPLPIARPAPPPVVAPPPVAVPKSKDTPLTKETLKDINKQIEAHPLVPSKGKSAPTGKAAPTGKGTLGTGITGFTPGQNLGQYGRGAQNQMSTPPPGVGSTAGEAMRSLYNIPISYNAPVSNMQMAQNTLQQQIEQGAQPLGGQYQGLDRPLVPVNPGATTLPTQPLPAPPNPVPTIYPNITYS